MTQKGPPPPLTLPRMQHATLLLVVALSMLITPLLFILYELLSRRMSERGEAFEPDEIDEQGPVIIAGIGRFGVCGRGEGEDEGGEVAQADQTAHTDSMEETGGAGAREPHRRGIVPRRPIGIKRPTSSSVLHGRTLLA